MLTNELKNSIKQHALEENPKECCGIIYKNSDDVLSLFKCKNISTNPEDHFLIDGKEYLQAFFLGEIVGTYHSHTKNENFSYLDKINANGHALVSVMYHINKDFFKTYVPQKNNNIYINRPFEIGKIDCFSLVRDYYKQEFNIEIENFSRTEESLESQPDFFSKRFKDANASVIIEGPINNENFSKLNENDVLIFKDNNNKESHMAIYLGGDTILHHRRNKLSCMEPFHQIYKKKVAFVIRHNHFIE